MTKTPRLKKYAAKRRAGKTPEPFGGGADPGEPVFVVQKHAAGRLHYDLRLQVGDTLRSWAVPEGPSLDPKVRRFAKEVEDHPLDYAAFEGRIPEGEYGAGTVIVWDRGTWTSVAEPAEALEKGELKFRLVGEKLRGGWMLKRLPDDPTNWLLIKERDPAAKPTAEFDVVKEQPDGVVTGVSVVDVAPLPKQRKPPRPKIKQIVGGLAAAMPKTWSPELAGEASVPPPGDDWVHEIKYDGYRTVCLFEQGKVRLLTRNKHDWTAKYAAVAKALEALPCNTAIIDGEIAVQDLRGVTRIDLLERALSEAQQSSLTYFAFDLCYLDGHDLTGAPLIERKQALEGLIDPLISERSPIQYSQHITANGGEFYARACELGLEGIISKKAQSRYVQARSNDWLKVKRSETGELVIIGFLSNAPKVVSSLALAMDREGELHYAGKVGSGISDERGRELFKLLSPHVVDDAPTEIPTDAGSQWSKDPLKGVRWVEPVRTAIVAHRGITPSGAVRQAVLLKTGERKRAAQPKRIRPRLVTDRDLAGIHLTNPDREMFKGSGVTKLDIALHYAKVGDAMLPGLLRRPVTIVRCTTGEQKDCFYQRHAFQGLPDGVERVDLSDEEGRAAFISIVNPKGFLALAQFGAVEFHPWGCTIDKPDEADRLVIDLDPTPEISWGQVCDAAEMLRGQLEKLGFQAFLRTTGGKGLHLVMALGSGSSWADVKTFAQGFAKKVSRDAPQHFTAELLKAKRGRRIFIDYLRNARGATAVASFSLRARDGFPVAAPIEWSELRSLGGGNAFTIATIENRLGKDPWSELGSNPTRITPKMARDIG